MAPETAEETIAAAQRGAKLIANAAQALVAVAVDASGEAVGPILKPGVDAAALAATNASDVICAIAGAIAGIDPDKHSMHQIGTYSFWAGAASIAIHRLSHAATLGLIGTADLMVSNPCDQRALAKAREDARQGGLLLESAAEGISFVLASLTDPGNFAK